MYMYVLFVVVSCISVFASVCTCERVTVFMRVCVVGKLDLVNVCICACVHLCVCVPFSGYMLFKCVVVSLCMALSVSLWCRCVSCVFVCCVFQCPCACLSVFLLYVCICTCVCRGVWVRIYIPAFNLIRFFMRSVVWILNRGCPG